MGRDYVGVEISKSYVEKAKKRLAELKNHHQSNSFLDAVETSELKRLLSDMERPAGEIAADENLLELFTNQFAVRLNGRKQYSTEKIIAALEDLAG